MREGLRSDRPEEPLEPPSYVYIEGNACDEVDVVLVYTLHRIFLRISLIDSVLVSAHGSALALLCSFTEYQILGITVELIHKTP